VGTIVIPVFSRAEEDPEAALADSAFKPVWDVIRALRAHDADLAEQLDSLRRELGRGASKVTIPPKIHLDLPARIGLDFASAFDVRLVEQTTSVWEFWLGLLSTTSRRLGVSVCRQTTPLEGSGLACGAPSAAGSEGQELAAYVQEHGDARVPIAHSTPGGFTLESWCSNRRSDHKRGALDPERIAALDALGFIWGHRQDDTWTAGLAELGAYVKAHGNARVPQAHSAPSGFNLGAWCGTQRIARKAGRLRAQRVAALDALGFAWDTYREAFDRGLAELAAYVEANGDARVPQVHVTATGFKLGEWCLDQRKARKSRKARKLSAERLDALDELGFVWDAHQEAFDRGFAELVAYVEANGDARVSKRDVLPSGFRLGAWCQKRRLERKVRTLSAERVAALDALGFVWDPFQERFDRGLAELAAYVQAHGDAGVPATYSTPGGFNLGSWCSTSR